MQALVWNGPRSMQIQDVPEPVPSASEVRVRVQAVGICGSELSGFLGHNSLRVPPLIMGHECAGVIDATGSDVDPLLLGRRVVIDPLLSCGSCRECAQGRTNLCASRTLIGIHRPGAFAEAVVVPSTSCRDVPPSLGAVEASLVEPLACSIRAVRLAGDVSGARVGVIGAGPIGAFAALVARHKGAVVEVQEVNQARAATLVRWGLTATPQRIGRCDVVIDAVGRAATRAAAVEVLARGGTAVFVGLHEVDTGFDGNDLVRDEKVVRGSFAYSHDDVTAAIEFLAQGHVPPPDPAWLSVRHLSDGPDAFRELVDTQTSVSKVVLEPGDTRSGGTR